MIQKDYSDPGILAFMQSIPIHKPLLISLVKLLLPGFCPVYQYPLYGRKKWGRHGLHQGPGRIRKPQIMIITGADPIVPPLLGLSGFWQAVDHLSLWVQKDIPFQIQIPGSPPVKFAENSKKRVCTDPVSVRRLSDLLSDKLDSGLWKRKNPLFYKFFPAPMAEDIRFIKIPKSSHHMENLIQGFPHLDFLFQKLQFPRCVFPDGPKRRIAVTCFPLPFLSGFPAKLPQTLQLFAQGSVGCGKNAVCQFRKI